MPSESDIGGLLTRLAERVDARARPVVESGEAGAGSSPVATAVMDPNEHQTVASFLEAAHDPSAFASILAIPVELLGSTPVQGARDAAMAVGLVPTFVGMSPSPTAPSNARHVVVVSCGLIDRSLAHAPPDFSVTAIVTAFNEADIIRSTALWLLEQDIDVIVVDNWSSDGTADLVADLAESGRLRVVKYPADGPSEEYDWHGLLTCVEQLAWESGSDWVVHHDSDQRHEGPWAGYNFRDSLYTVHRAGFTAVDHTVFDFRPTADVYPPGTEPTDHFRYFEFDHGASSSVHVQAWRNTEPADLANSGGHQVQISDRRTFPFNFSIRHYGIRSQEHGERKVFRDRRPRYRRDELDRGWHDHYYRFTRRHQFVRDPDTLFEYRRSTFEEDYLLERLGQVGMHEAQGTVADLTGAKPIVVRTLRRAGLLRPMARARNVVRTMRR